jgi:hypothetical protein
MINAVRREAEDMFESVNSTQDSEYLRDDATGVKRRDTESDVGSMQEHKRSLVPEFPKLALTEDQFGMIDALDGVGFKKYPVYIHNHRHSHAAIIVRMDKKSFDEGRVVIKHWLDNFEL